jgi:acetyl-CoA decarbonylase/synthase complex subunit epsilon
VIGHRSLIVGEDGEQAIDLLVRGALKTEIPIAATGDTGSALAERGVQPALCISAMTLANLLADPGWTGADGGGPHDLVLVAGLSYALEWTLLSGLRHGAPHLITVSLSPGYEPHASFSLPNLTWPAWRALISAAFELEESA